SPQEGRSVQEHLVACWQCRARRKEFEDEALRVAKSLAADSFPGPAKVAEAVQKFSTWERQLTRPPAARAKRSLFPAWWGRLIPVAAALVVMLGAWLAYELRGPAAPQPSEIIAQTRQYEDALFGQPVHQVFTVAVAETRPVVRSRRGRLEVWSDGADERYTSRWIDSEGKLIHAVWRPGDHQDYIYSHSSAAVVRRQPTTPGESWSLTELSRLGLMIEDLEAGFVQWLESRWWRPFSVASDISSFVSQEGVHLEVSALEADAGERHFRLTARRTEDELTVEVVVDVDAGTYQPRLQTIRFETPDRAAEISLVAERVETIATPYLTASLFRPDQYLTRPKPAPPPRVQPLTPPPPPDEPKVTPAELALTEVEVHYALHRVGACLGEPVEVIRDAENRVLVRGL
ncbi:MAG: hypothetical protein GY953_48650, partial [bacterium]|nr:hypothetical protein [bacterium]